MQRLVFRVLHTTAECCFPSGMFRAESCLSRISRLCFRECSAFPLCVAVLDSTSANTGDGTDFIWNVPPYAIIIRLGKRIRFRISSITYLIISRSRAPSPESCTFFNFSNFLIEVLSFPNLQFCKHRSTLVEFWCFHLAGISSFRDRRYIIVLISVVRRCLDFDLLLFLDVRRRSS